MKKLFNYKNPTNIMIKKFSDFYILAYMWQLKKLKPEICLNQNFEKLDYEIEFEFKKICEYLKKELYETLRFCIACELSHLDWLRFSKKRNRIDNKKILKYCCSGLEYKKRYKEMLKMEKYCNEKIE
jgi:hypothetical protein